jgi:hypothetical protein
MRSTISRGVGKRGILMLFALGLLLVASCVPPRGGGDRFYVVVRPEETGRFLDALVSIAKGEGLHSNVGQATNDKGEVLHVVEAEGHGVRLWAQNVLLIGNEDPTVCGVHEEPYSDPAQFIVYAKPTWLAFSRKSAVEVEGNVFARLRALGYEVDRKQALCGLAKLGN